MCVPDYIFFEMQNLRLKRPVQNTSGTDDGEEDKTDNRQEDHTQVETVPVSKKDE